MRNVEFAHTRFYILFTRYISHGRAGTTKAPKSGAAAGARCRHDDQHNGGRFTRPRCRVGSHAPLTAARQHAQWQAIPVVRLACVGVLGEQSPSSPVVGITHVRLQRLLERGAERSCCGAAAAKLVAGRAIALLVCNGRGCHRSQACLRRSMRMCA